MAKKKKSSAYWKKRFSDLEAANNAYGQRTFHQIEPAFDKAQRQIQAQIESWYSRYAKNNGITMAEARKQLSAAELKELQWDVQEYIKYGQQNAMNQQWMKELENASARFHISRLEALKLRTQQSLEVAFGNELDSLDGMVKHLYQSGYYHTCFEVQKGFNIGWEIGQIDERKLQKIISKPWAADGKTFSDRVWQSKTTMVNELHQQLTRAIIQGKAPDEAIRTLSKYVADKTKNAKYAAGRLVMTEQAFISSAAQKDAFNDLDVEEFEIVATLDSHTSEICQNMDGQHFPMKDFEPGVTAPPFHVWCRSTTVPYFDDEWGRSGERAARGEDGKTYYVPSDMTYPEWQKSFVDGQTSGLKPAEPVKVKEPSVENANKVASDAILEQYDHRVNDLGVGYVPTSEWDEAQKKAVADFTGMDARLAESTAQQFKTLSSEYESMCQKIEVIKFDPMMATAPASTSPQMNIQQATMSFNKGIMKDHDSFIERMQKAVDRGQFPMMSEAEYEKYVVTHEFAHTLMDFESPLKNYVGAETSHIKAARKEIKSIREAYQERIRTLTIAQKQAELDAITSFDETAWTKAQKLTEELKKVQISKYADMSIDEFMAEAFTDAKIGSDPSEYSKQVLEVIDKYFKKKKH